MGFGRGKSAKVYTFNESWQYTRTIWTFRAGTFAKQEDIHQEGPLQKYGPW